ncbi:hypothetical protein MA16_Dca028332 [Dendrobium catenatum]|uniref:Uncharacterized protein n=1 Tax=Dendrobium catenatum TaxID=906689 RepID=A0A2I0V882_9ASPA|nr:hypothetical protein MA16_Dca028332 [Dendrobium catenatum]
MISPLDPLIPSSSTLSTPVGSTFSPPMTKFSLLRYGYFIYDGAVIFSPSVQRKFRVSRIARLCGCRARSDTFCGLFRVRFDRGSQRNLALILVTRDPKAAAIDRTGYAVSEIDG